LPFIQLLPGNEGSVKSKIAADGKFSIKYGNGGILQKIFVDNPEMWTYADFESNPKQESLF
jgi:hypothetical protein